MENPLKKDRIHYGDGVVIRVVETVQGVGNVGDVMKVSVSRAEALLSDKRLEGKIEEVVAL